MVIILVFSALSSFVLTHDRVAQLIRSAMEQGDLAYGAHTDEDFVTECALLEMQYLRPKSALINTIETRVVVAPGLHLCQSLQVLVLGPASARAQLPLPFDADHYFFGARFLEAYVLSVLNFRPAAVLYQIVSYGSVLVLLAVMFWRSPRQAVVLSPIPSFLLYAFALHRFGQNLGHAPAFFVGFFGLSGLIGAKQTFKETSTRFCFFGALGVITAYFDLLTGSIPVLFGLSMIANHFYYSERDGVDPSYLPIVFRQGAMIALCFVFGYAALTLLRLALLATADSASTDFLSSLAFRFGTIADNGAPVTLPLMAEALWNARFQLTPGGYVPATLVLLFALLSWLFALIAFPAALRRTRRFDGTLVADMLVLIAAGTGVIVWYVLLPGHTYTHALFAVRTISFSSGCGVAAALLVARGLIGLTRGSSPRQEPGV